MKSKKQSLYDLDRRLAKLDALVTDLKAARERLLAGDSPPGKTVPGPATTPKAGREKRKSFDQNRLAIAAVIAAEGPTGSTIIAKKSGVNLGHVTRYLQTTWFYNSERKWGLTNEGQTEMRRQSN